LLTRLSRIADRIQTPPQSQKTVFKFSPEKAAKQTLRKIIHLLAEVGVALSPNLQTKILQLQGKTKFAELFLRKSDLVLKPTGFLELSSIKSLLIYNAEDRIFHARPMDFFIIHKFLEKQGYPIISYVKEDFALPLEIREALHLDYVLRKYQSEALNRWLGANKRGVVVLPTGAGKTVVALEAIRQLGLKTLIVVPTIDLLNQWREILETHLKVSEVGLLGGGSKTVQAVTVATYDSASLMAAKIAEFFGFLVFDEVHHLPSPTYRLAAELFIAPHRLGLSATPERYDELHRDLDRLVGPVVYRISPRLLEQEGYLAPFRIETIQVDLTSEEKARYDEFMAVFRAYTKKLDEIEPGWQFETIVERTIFDHDARRALSHLEKARRIALEASEKINHVEKLLHKYKDTKVIIFCRYTRVVEKVSDIFGIPLITHKTKAAEREAILRAFKEGHYTKIATGHVLDEGVDVPDAAVGIIISGSGSKREFIQRLGRLLRPQKEEAVLIEIITKATLEDGLARRRRQIGRTSS
jgi:superfamily II DNA or RNA helicase